MSQKSIEHIALYSLVLVGTLVVGVLARCNVFITIEQPKLIRNIRV